MPIVEDMARWLKKYETKELSPSELIRLGMEIYRRSYLELKSRGVDVPEGDYWVRFELGRRKKLASRALNALDIYLGKLEKGQAKE